jgi:subtilisin-like proprotein convertase family protein
MKYDVNGHQFPSGLVNVATDSISTNDIGKKSVIVSSSSVSFIESVQLEISLQVRDFGDLEIALISPYGTRSILLTTGNNLTSQSYPHGLNTINNLQIISNSFYGENPTGNGGEWKLEVIDGVQGYYLMSLYNRFTILYPILLEKYYQSGGVGLSSEEIASTIADVEAEMKATFQDENDKVFTNSSISAQIGSAKITFFGH